MHLTLHLPIAIDNLSKSIGPNTFIGRMINSVSWGSLFSTRFINASQERREPPAPLWKVDMFDQIDKAYVSIYIHDYDSESMGKPYCFVLTMSFLEEKETNWKAREQLVAVPYVATEEVKVDGLFQWNHSMVDGDGSLGAVAVASRGVRGKDLWIMDWWIEATTCVHDGQTKSKNLCDKIACPLLLTIQECYGRRRNGGKKRVSPIPSSSSKYCRNLFTIDDRSDWINSIIANNPF